MATIKFSEFPPGNITANTAQVVGLEGSNNVRFTPSDLVNGLATITYVDAQDAGLQSQITQNANDIAAIDPANINANITTLQGQVSVLQGNIIVLEGAVAALENNVSINQDDIATLQGNIVAIENELANIADTDAQTLSWDGANANLSISNGNNIILQEVLDNAGNITVMQGQIADLQANGNIQTLSLDNSSNVLSISGGNTVDFTTVLGNVAGGGGGNPFDQDLNTTDSPTFDNLSTTGELDINGTGTHTFEGTIEFTQLTNFGGTVGITSILDEDNMVSDSATALATQQSIKAYVDANAGGGSNYSNANVTAYAEAGWAGNIVPSANITYDLGTLNNRWKDLYLSNATIFLGNTELSTSNGAFTVDGTEVKNTFGTTISIVNTSTDVYNRNGILPADPQGMAIADPNSKSGWYWKSPGPTADPAGLNTFQWKMFNNDGPQTFTVADIDYIYMIVDLYTVGQVYFNVYTAGINPAPTAFQSRFSFTLNGDFSSTGRYLMWAKPPGSDITVDDVEVYPFLERLELPYNASTSSGSLLTSEAIKSVNVQTRTSPALSEGEVEFNLKAVGYKVNNNYIQNFDMEIYGGDQSLSLDNSSNVLTISNGGNVDFTTVLGNVGGGGGGLTAVVDDTSPQLGGTLSTNGFNIEVSNGGPLEFGVEWNDGSGTKYGDIVAQPDANEFEISSGPGARDLIIVGDRDVEIKTGLTGRDIIIGDLTWPDSDGTANQVLVTDGSGQLSFAAGGVRLANLDIANATISSNSATNSMDVQFDSKPVAKITSGVMVQVHGSWDASAGAAFNWSTNEIASHGISNVTRDSAGIYTVTFETPFATNAYTVTTGVGSTDYSGTGASPRQVSVLTRNAGSCTIICERTDDAVNEDNFYMSLMICGVI